MNGGTLKSMLPRLTAEFVVIVVGVLFALAVDSWVSGVRDRELEREYLQRLLDDVRYDLGEFLFLDAVGQLGLEASLELGSVDTVGDLEPSLLVAMVMAAANEREPDLSRAAYEELLSSGRIDLIRELDARVALAEYDRWIEETRDVWLNLSPQLRVWAFSRIPTSVNERLNAACASDPENPLYTILTVCAFDLDGWSVSELRSDVGGADAQRRLRLASHRFRTGLVVTQQLRAVAGDLEKSLVSALGGS